MKVRIEKAADVSETEIVIRTAEMSHDIERLRQRLTDFTANNQTITCGQGAETRYVPVTDVLFIETADRRLQVHTADDILINHQRLYELAAELPQTFMQISKSAIVNLNQVNALTRSLSSCLISFQDSSKQVYASRRYYQELKTRLNEMRS